MSNLGLILSPTALTIFVAGAAAFGVLLWWLIRRRRQRIRLPTLRIMELENRRLPRLIWTLPPWIAFIGFVATALSYAFFSARPAKPVMIPTRPDEHRVHIFVDLSPSVASETRIEALAARVGKLFEMLRTSNQVTLSGSSFGVQEVPDGQAAEKLILASGFHRGGLHLGEALKTQTPDLGDVDRLMVVSDRDQHSWEDLNWSFLQESMEIFRVPAGNESQSRDSNFFFQAIRGVPSADGLRQEWDVEIAANRPLDQDRKGTLAVKKGDKIVTESPWRIQAGKERAQLRVGWPGDDAVHGDDTLEWHLQIADALEADNLYRTHSVGARPDVLVLSDPGGERFLEDPAHHLEVTLDVLGFRVSRWDSLENGLKSAATFPLWIVQGGTGRGVDTTCPSLYGQWRNDPKSLPESAKKPPVIWLSPFDEPADYRELCHCYTRLAVQGAHETGLPRYCEDIQTRDQWVGVLSSLGARQIGGEVGDFSGALAWHRKDETSGTEVLAFTVPLRPRLSAGVTYGDLPRLLRSLLQWQGFLKETGPEDSWPRPTDIGGLNADERAALKDANVPTGESLLVDLPDNVLPPLWSDTEGAASGTAMLRRDESDPMPWLFTLAAIILIATLAEATLKISRRVRRGLKHRATVLLLCCGLFAAGEGRSEILLNLVGYPEPVSPAMRLAREVAGRTSIDLHPIPQSSANLDAKALEQPWLWVRSPKQLQDDKGRLPTKLVDWIERGGFLVIENASGKLDALTGTAFPFLKENEGWKPIPPDHELMRSFHLLEALPVCSGQVWQGFNFDGRLAILAIPHSLLDQILDQPKPVACLGRPDQERGTRLFINLMMVALATDYKKDQIHLPEILKRLR